MNDFIKLVQRMRVAQRMFFRTRSAEALDNAKDLELQVDAFIADYYIQQTLF